MKLNDLTKTIRENIRKKLNIVSTLTILNVPKQKLLEKGNMILLLDEDVKPISFSWTKDNKEYLELHFPLCETLIANIVISDNTKQFESEQNNGDSENDMDFVVDYNDLDTILKKKLRDLIRSGEKQLEESNSKFGKFNKVSLLKNFKSTQGSFDQWLKDKGFGTPNIECFKEAYKEADQKNDLPFKKRAAYAKCLYKINVSKK